jgi:integrase
MASLENRTGYWNVVFRFGGQKFNRSLKTKDEKEAEARKVRLEENLRLVESGRLHIPDGADIVTFLLSDGQLTSRPIASDTLTLARLFSEFFQSLPGGSHEDSTLNGMQIHRRHLERLLGKRFVIQTITTDDLQKYVTKRSEEKGLRGTVGPNTIHKELVTFRTVWGWGVDTDRLVGDFPRKGVRLPKSRELPPFQTWAEIERQTDDPKSEMWDCLYLTLPQIEELLKDVKRYSAYPFIYPMFTFAAYTGARRSEMLRSQLSDIDLSAKIVTLREKKRVRGKLTTRRVPISPPLAKVLRQWIKDHPGGPHTFCQNLVVERSRKTKQREDGHIALTRDEAAHHFRQTVDESKWEVLKGWHCLRHSFISNCASKGIDQRMIDEWVGHSTEAMRRRYPERYKRCVNGVVPHNTDRCQCMRDSLIREHIGEGQTFVLKKLAAKESDLLSKPSLVTITHS